MAQFQSFLQEGQQMLHVVKLIQRRFPHASGRIITTLVLLSGSALALGVGILLSQ